MKRASLASTYLPASRRHQRPQYKRRPHGAPHQSGLTHYDPKVRALRHPELWSDVVKTLGQPC